MVCAECVQFGMPDFKRVTNIISVDLPMWLPCRGYRHATHPCYTILGRGLSLESSSWSALPQTLVILPQYVPVNIQEFSSNKSFLTIKMSDRAPFFRAVTPSPLKAWRRSWMSIWSAVWRGRPGWTKWASRCFSILIAWLLGVYWGNLVE